MNQELGRNLELASEKEFRNLFADCEPGDHEHLVWLDRREFKELMASLPHSIISKDAEVGCWRY